MARFLDTSVKMDDFQDKEREGLISRQENIWTLTTKSKPQSLIAHRTVASGCRDAVL